MIDILKIIRKSKISLWSVIGDKWDAVKYNIYSNKLIESFWSANEILANGRMNYLLNIEDRLSQFTPFGYLDFLILDNLKSNLKIGADKTYPYEYKIYYDDISQYKGIKIKSIVPPDVLTNSVLPTEYITDLYTGIINSVNSKDKWLFLAEDDKLNSLNTDLYNYFIIDSNKNPFVIQTVTRNKIFYKNVLTNTIPVTGEFSIKNKFELLYNKDFITKELNTHLLLKFKDFKYVKTLYDIPKSFSKEPIDLFAVNCKINDNLTFEHFGKPIGLNDDHVINLKKTGDKNNIVDSKILKLWKLNQRPYNFQQIFRLGSIISDQPHAVTINDPEIIYDINLNENKVYTSKVISIVYGKVLRFKDLSEDLQSIFTYSTIELDKFNIIKLDDNYNNLGFKASDILLIDGENYKIKKIFDSKYFEVNKEVSAGLVSREIKVISRVLKKEYILEPGTYRPDLAELDNIVPFKQVVWGQKTWGSFVWGEINGKPINEKCNFKQISIGDEYLYGDSFIQTVLADYFENSVYTEYIQKQLAIDNKAFIQSNVEEYLKNKSLVLMPFLNYSENSRDKNLEYLITDDIERIVTSSGYLVTNGKNIWMASAGTTSSDIEQTNYNLAYKNIIFNSKGNYMIYGIENNKTTSTDICMISFYLRVNSGKVRIGGANENSFLTATDSKFVYYDNKKWIHKKIFFNKSELFINRILIEAYSDDTDIDIFGLEFFTSVPSFCEKIYDNKQIFTDLISRNDYKLINLL